MKVLGIIAEYNPITNGHVYHLEKSKEMSEADFVVVVMSGDFTQRGEPAIFDKWVRTEMALAAGVDLVLELPFVFATGSAESFAKGGVSILEALKLVTHLSFGTEEGDLSDLSKIADLINNNSDDYRRALKEGLNEGLSYGAAVEAGVTGVLGKDTGVLLKKPNNILALEYLKAIETITPVTIKRIGAEYNDDSYSGRGFASATTVRRMLLSGGEDYIEHVPESSHEIIKREATKLADKNSHGFFKMIRTSIISKTKEELGAIHGMEEGIENRIIREIRNAGSYDELVERIRSRRFPATRVRRLLTYCLMGVQNPDCDISKVHARVLGFNDKGAELLRIAGKREDIGITLITNINRQEVNSEMLSYDIRSADMYNELVGNDLYSFSDYVKKPVIISE